MEEMQKVDDKKIKKRIYKARTNVRLGKFFSLIFKCILIIIACILTIQFDNFVIDDKYNYFTIAACMVMFPTAYLLMRTIIGRIQEYRLVKKDWMNNDIYKCDGTFIEMVEHGRWKFAKVSTCMGDIVGVLIPEELVLEKGAKVVVFCFDLSHMNTETFAGAKTIFTYEEYGKWI